MSRRVTGGDRTEHRYVSGPPAPGNSRTRTRIFFFAVPPPEARDAKGNKMEPLRFALLRDARNYADSQGNGWHVEQRREPLNLEPEAPPDEES